MLSRKRKQINDLQDKFSISTQPAHFDPILESLTRFLECKDCAHVSVTNSVYHCKTWKYFLTSSKNTDHKIQLNGDSIPWITKYCRYLAYQEVDIHEHQYIIDLSIIPRLKTLYMYRVSCTNLDNDGFVILPLQVKHYRLSNVVAEIPEMIGTKKVSLFQSSLISDSTFVKSMYVSDVNINCEKLPNFSNLKQLEMICRYVVHPNFILEKYPNLTYLEITCYCVNFITALQLFRGTLVISSWDLINISSFCVLQCSKLDLTQSPNITDFSGVSHIPIVIKAKT
jgi:hypothetical protein